MTENRSDDAAVIRREALGGAVVSVVVNAAIQAFLLEGKGPHRISVDSIASREPTLFGVAVPMAVCLAATDATITFFRFRKKAAAAGFASAERLARPCFPFGLGQAVSAALSVFGALVVAGVLWQKYLGEVAVGTTAAALFAGLVAAVTTVYVSRRTAWALLRERARAVRSRLSGISRPASGPDAGTKEKRCPSSKRSPRRTRSPSSPAEGPASAGGSRSSSPPQAPPSP